MVQRSKTSTRKKADGEHGKQYHFYCTYVHTSLVYCSSCTISRQKVATVCVCGVQRRVLRSRYQSTVQSIRYRQMSVHVYVCYF